MTTCKFSGRTILSCKVSDLCDCFDYPEADGAAAEIIRERDRRYAERRKETP